MSRKRVATASQLRFEIQRRIRESVEGSRACRDCQAPLPRRAAAGDTVANWTADPLPDVDQACHQFVADIVAEMRRDYEMIEK